MMSTAKPLGGRSEGTRQQRGPEEGELLVSVVIPAHNAAETIGLCLQACLDQDYPAHRLEIIVVDDGSTDETAEVVGSYPVTYLGQAQAGTAAARNSGWRASQGEIVCFTDSDCLPARDWVSNLILEYDQAGIGGVGGTYEIANPESRLATWIHQEIAYRHQRMPRWVDYLGGFNLSFRRSVLEELGGYDESYRMASGEDNDLSYRVAEAGWRLVFTPRARVAHIHEDRLKRYLKTQFWHGYWRMKLYRRHPQKSLGDVYGTPLDLVQPPLAASSLGLLPLVWSVPGLWAWAVVTGSLIALQLNQIIRLAWTNRRLDCLSYVGVLFIRSYIRAVGACLGLVRFYQNRPERVEER